MTVTHCLTQTDIGPTLVCIDHPMPTCPLAGWWRAVGWECLTTDDLTEMPDRTLLDATWSDDGPVITAMPETPEADGCGVPDPGELMASMAWPTHPIGEHP